MNPSERRLAMLVEDHPRNYRDFEGIIPSGYGKGTVIGWDGGNYNTPAIKQKDKENSRPMGKIEDKEKVILRDWPQ